MIRTISTKEEELSIVSGFDRTLYDGFKNALERGQEKAWQQITAFVQKQLIYAYGHKEIAVMHQLYWLPSAMYNLSTGNPEVAGRIAKDFAAFFPMLAWYFSSDDKSKDPIGESPQRFNLFYKTLLSFYHYAIHHPDEAVVRDILNEFKSIAGGDYDFDTRSTIQERDGFSQAEKKAIREGATKKYRLMIAQRQATLALYAWVTYLFMLNELSLERASFLIDQLYLRYNFFEDLLSDIDYIRSNESDDYLGITFWDYTERPDKQVYSPPSAYDWIIYGPCIVLLRDELPNFSEAVIIDDRGHAFLLYNVKEKLEEMKTRLEPLAKLLRWSSIINDTETITADEQLKQRFEEKEEQITSLFLRVQTLHEEEENRLIADQPLDEKLVADFKAALYKRWKDACLSYWLFEYNHALTTVDTTDDLTKHGQSVFLDHQKMMFVTDGQQTIYNSTDLGSAIGRTVDDQFVYDITRQITPQQLSPGEDYGSVTAGLESCINRIRADGFLPDIILLPSNLFYNSDLRSTPKYKSTDMRENPNQIGVFDGIPVFRMFAKTLASKAIVASFQQALRLSVYENSALYEHYLHLDLHELSTTEIDARYKRETVRWTTSRDNAQLTEKQAKLRLASSLILELWTMGKFTILESKAVAWCQFKPLATENK
jgi:hypothetical protein